MKTVLVTGASSGIGRATSLELGRRGFQVVAAGRSEERTTPVVEAIFREGGSAEFLHLDLASLNSCVSAAQTFKASSRPLDVLINNAGVGAARDTTEDGFEIHFGVNHLGHFMFTRYLQEAFLPGTRIVVVSSEMHRRADGIDFASVRRKTRSIGGLSEYAVSKLANILHARRLAALHPEWRTYSVHPGLADTNIFPSLVKPFIRNKLPAAVAARTSVWCATSEEVADHTGRYYSRMELRAPSPVANDDQLASELWERSAAWCEASSGT